MSGAAWFIAGWISANLCLVVGYWIRRPRDFQHTSDWLHDVEQQEQQFGAAQ